VFEACLTLAQNRNEAQLLAESLDALARALREWPREAWQKVNLHPTGGGLFERLLARTQPAALDTRQRELALESAEAVAAVLRVLWPDTRAHRAAEPELFVTTS